MVNMLQVIADLRGGIPECCDFCEQPYTEERYPVPEEAGAWACIECWDRWEKQDACPHNNVTKTEHLTGEGAMEYVEWYDCFCSDCGEEWTRNA